MQEPAEGEGTFSLRQRVLLAAEAIIDFAQPCYGPRGMSKAIMQPDGSIRILSSGASALRDVGVVDPDIQPYVDLAGAVQEHAGDQATGALLLAARLIRNGCNEIAAGVPAAAFLDGYALAQRQARAAIGAAATPDPQARGLASVVPGEAALAPLVVEGLRTLGEGRAALPLDAIEITTEGTVAEWLPGVIVRPQHEPRKPAQGTTGILLVTDDWKPGPWKEGLSYKMTAKHALGAWSASEDALRQRALEHLVTLKVGLLVCHREIEEGLAQMCIRRGITVWNDAPESAMQRIERATGARPVGRLMHAQAADIGRGTLSARPRRSAGWLLAGAGPSATLCLPGLNALSQAESRDHGERLLRAAGSWLREPERVPGGGRWQRDVARSIRQAADAAPGKTPLALRAAAEALDGLADALVRSFGKDPLSLRLPGDAAQIFDLALPVRVAVVGAFEMAIQVLGVDDRYAKKPTSTAGLRGGEGKPLSVREMAGDVPPLM